MVDGSSDVSPSDLRPCRGHPSSPRVVQTPRRAYRVLPVWNDAPRDEKWRVCAPRQGVSRSEAESRRKPSAIVPLSRGTAESLPTFLKKRCADKDIRVTCGFARHCFYLALRPFSAQPEIGRASCRERVCQYV